MAVFQVSVTSAGVVDIESNGTIITLLDHSGYDSNTEDGHDQSMFNYKKIKFINPDGSEYLFSTQGDGDTLIATPAASTLPITTNYTYTTGDGLYYAILIAVPTWQNDVTYNLLSTHCVLYGTALYRAISNSIPVGTVPTNTTYWEVVTDANLPSKYRLCQAFAVYCDARQCYLDSIHNAYCGIATTDYCGVDFCKNEYFLLSAKLLLLLDQVDSLVDSNDWAKVTDVINLTKTLCCCNE